MISNMDLWEKIDRFSLKDLGEGSFFKKLLIENSWSAPEAHEAIKEYKKFMYLAIVAEHRVSPPQPVDKVWHTHLTYTDNYWNDFCPNVLGKTIHHNPSDSSKATREDNKNDFEKTIKRYKQEFDTEPFPTIWDTAYRNRYYFYMNMGIWLMVAFVGILFGLDASDLGGAYYPLLALVGAGALIGFYYQYSLEPKGDAYNAAFKYTSCGSCEGYVDV